jgi:hypothetical protein
MLGWQHGAIALRVYLRCEEAQEEVKVVYAERIGDNVEPAGCRPPWLLRAAAFPARKAVRQPRHRGLAGRLKNATAYCSTKHAFLSLQRSAAATASQKRAGGLPMQQIHSESI